MQKAMPKAMPTLAPTFFSSSQSFQQRSAVALKNATLRAALGKAGSGFLNARKNAFAEIENSASLKARAQQARTRAIDNMAELLLLFEHNAQAKGIQVHWAETAEQACAIIIDLCRGKKRIIKGKSMVSEEIELNAALLKSGAEVIETDLGEYIIQLANETPSHIIAPAVHKTRAQIDALFRYHHENIEAAKVAENNPKAQRPISVLVEEARQKIRDKFLQAEVGITGANMLIATRGAGLLLTNEGNGDLSAIMPQRHIMLSGIERIIADDGDAAAVLRVLGRSATGQSLGSYMSLYGGQTRQNKDHDKDHNKDNNKDHNKDLHFVLLDNGRSKMHSSAWRDMLRCIRCGACLNHCPVYSSVGGHAYGWVYSGPMGKVLTPLLAETSKKANAQTDTQELPHASSFCGRCVEVCPVGIPLTSLMRKLRERDFEQPLRARRLKTRLACAVMRLLFAHPKLYRLVIACSLRVLKFLARGKGHISYLPTATAWTNTRDLPINRSARSAIASSRAGYAK